MNGLKYIRMRCNLSLADLAKHIGVSRQIVSAWENGTRGISDRNLKKLSAFFGLEPSYFGELSESEQEEILSKAMYLRKDGGKVYYRYSSSGERETQVFLPELEKGLDEIYGEAIARKKATIDEVEGIIQGNESDNLYVHSHLIQQYCCYYESLSWILSNKTRQAHGTMLPYVSEVSLMLDVLRQAFDDTEDFDFSTVGENFGYTERDGQWANKICREIRAHRLKKVEDHLAENKRRRGTREKAVHDKNSYRERGVK